MALHGLVAEPRPPGTWIPSRQPTWLAGAPYGLDHHPFLWFYSFFFFCFFLGFFLGPLASPPAVIPFDSLDLG